MCGIAGAVGVPRVPVETRHAVLERLRPRGPDSSGELPPGSLPESPGEDVWLGIRRLAVIDVEGGDQPLFNEDGSIAVVCNGEIYNHVELRRELDARGHRFATRSDTEVLVHLYEDRGTDLCRELRGMFAFALWDRRLRLLLLARDRFGKKPLYWARTRSDAGDGLVFGSEVKAVLPLLRAVGVSPSLSLQAIYDYLSLAAVPQPATVWKEIRSLAPAAMLTFEDGEIAERRYWNLGEAVTEPSGAGASRARPLGYRAAAAAVREEVGEAVRLRLRSDVPLGVFLSAGLDSSVVAWEAARQTGSRLHTFTVSVDDPALDEAREAGAFARELGVDHTVLPLRVAPRTELEHLVEVFDQPFADPSALPSLAVARLAREHVTVVLNGDGGDEIFAGYRRYLAGRYGGALGRLARLLEPMLSHGSGRRRSVRGFLHRFLRGVDLAPGARYLVWTTDMWREEDKQTLWTGEPMRPTEDWIDTILPERGSALARQMAGDRAINLLSDLLVKMDLATMASSLEARSPLLDHVVAERVAALPESHLIRRGRLKAVLREAYRDVLPRSVLRAPKRGFEIPLAAWLAGDLAELVGDTVGAPGARIHDWLDRKAVARLLAGETFQDRNRPYLVYSLLVLELWLRRWC
jgi:asparagine synthase (glutamine-hydrolysing)